MSVPKYNELMPAIIECLGDGQIHTRRELAEYCSEVFQLNSTDRAEILSSGQNKLLNRVGWAQTYLKKAGLIDSPKRAHFCLTDKGKKAFESGSKAVTLSYLDQFDSFKQFKSNIISDNNSNINIVKQKSSESPQEQIENALEELNNTLADEIMSEIMKISSYEFERLVVKLLIKMGYGTMEESVK